MNQSLYFMSTMLTFSCMLPILCPIEYMFCTEMYRFLNYLIYKWESFFVVSVKIIKSKSVPTSAEKKCCTVSTLLDQSQTTYPKPRPFVVLVYIFSLLLYSFSMQNGLTQSVNVLGCIQAWDNRQGSLHWACYIRPSTKEENCISWRSSVHAHQSNNMRRGYVEQFMFCTSLKSILISRIVLQKVIQCNVIFLYLVLGTS